MKRNTSLKLVLLLGAAFGLPFVASAQNTNTPSASAPGDLSTVGGGGYGLLGQDYTGLEFGYTHHVDGPPAVLHRYGFVANRPATPANNKVNVDAMFKYSYTTGSDSGLHAWQHDMLIGGRGYWHGGAVRPYIEGNLGWAWTDNNLTSDNDSFSYLAGAGAEFQVGQRIVFTPYVNYQEMPHFHTRGWTFGAKAAYRLAREWSTILGAEIDEQNNIEYRVGVNRHW